MQRGGQDFQTLLRGVLNNLFIEIEVLYANLMFAVVGGGGGASIHWAAHFEIAILH